jgi:hypothetical protein
MKRVNAGPLARLIPRTQTTETKALPKVIVCDVSFKRDKTQSFLRFHLVRRFFSRFVTSKRIRTPFKSDECAISPVAEFSSGLDSQVMLQA